MLKLGSLLPVDILYLPCCWSAKSHAEAINFLDMERLCRMMENSWLSFKHGTSADILIDRRGSGEKIQYRENTSIK